MDLWRVLLSNVWEPLLSALLSFAPRLATGLAVLVVFWLVGKATRRVINRFGGGRKVDPDVTGLLATTAHVGLLLVGMVTALGTLGIDVTALVAGLGLTSLALGLALKEIISNALAGFLIMIYKPFRRGDHLTVLMSVECRGRVAEINLRFTALDGEKGRVFVPNTLLLSNAVAISPAAGTNEEARMSKTE